jgi:hypothetical protein
MDAVFHMLAESLASDNLWSVLVFLAALVLLASLRARSRVGDSGQGDL